MASPIHIFFSFGPRGCARVNNTKQPWQKETPLCQWVLWMSSLISNACVLHKCYKQAGKLSYRNTSWKMFNSTRGFFSSSQWLRGMKNPTCCASPTASLPSSSPTHTPTLRLRRSRSSSRPPALRWRPCGGRTGTPRRSRLVGQRPSPWITAQMNKRAAINILRTTSMQSGRSVEKHDAL